MPACKSALAVAAVLAASLLPLTACGHSGTSSSCTATSSSSASSATPAANRFNQEALDVLDAVIRGDWDKATACFDPQMQQQLSKKSLESAWSTYQEAFGKYKSHGNPQPVARGALTVVNVPLQMEHQPGEFRITFHADGTVAGLFFLKTGVPVP